MHNDVTYYAEPVGFIKLIMHSLNWLFSERCFETM